MHRLMTVWGEVEDREAAVDKSHVRVAVDPKSAIVRTTVRDSVAHTQQQLRIDFPAAKETCNAAHQNVIA
jgi:Fe-S cluster assembly iron-binding protein IscA